jgi:hypothetical protein
MIKFSASHSTILDTAGNDALKYEHESKLQKIARLLVNAGAEIVEITRVNVVAKIAEHELHKLFDFAEEAVEDFYGKITAHNTVIGHFIDHFEHHETHGPDGILFGLHDREYC